MSEYILTYGGSPITRTQGQYDFISTDWVDWVPMTWENERIPYYGDNVWYAASDSTPTLYYSQYNIGANYFLQWPVTGTSGSWGNTSWGSVLPSFDGKYMWNSVDGNTYYSNDSQNSYQLDVNNKRWTKKRWGKISLWGTHIWNFGGIDYGNEEYIYMPDADNWGIAVWWRDPPMYTANIDCYHLWKDNDGHVYYSYVTEGHGPEQYEIILSDERLTDGKIINPQGTFCGKTWYGLTNFYGEDVWHHPNGMIFYSRGTEQYVLDVSTSTWSPMTWKGLTSYYGRYVWTWGGRAYYSNGSDQYVLMW